MKLTDLVNQIGDEKIKVQFVRESIVSCKDKKRTCDTEVTIATNEICTSDVVNNSGKIGIVMWVDREEYELAVQKVKQL